MTHSSPASERGVRPITYIAVAASSVVAAVIWAILIGLTSPQAYDATIGLLPKSLFDNVEIPAAVLLAGLILAVVLDVIAGRQGGRNRTLAIVGGVALLSTFVPLIVGLLLDALSGSFL